MGDPFVTPLAPRDDDGGKIAPTLGQHIFLVGIAISGRNALEDAASNQVIEATGQRILGDPEIPLEVLEPPRAHHRIADDQQRPPGPDMIQRSRD